VAISRYQNDDQIRGGRLLQSATAVMRIRAAVKTGAIGLSPVIVKERQRLDKLAGDLYGDGRLWWVIAATSNIGWSLQVPPGTRLNVPTDLSQIMAVI